MGDVQRRTVLGAAWAAPVVAVAAAPGAAASPGGAPSISFSTVYLPNGGSDPFYVVTLTIYRSGCEVASNQPYQLQLQTGPNTWVTLGSGLRTNAVGRDELSLGAGSSYRIVTDLGDQGVLVVDLPPLPA